MQQSPHFSSSSLPGQQPPWEEGVAPAYRFSELPFTCCSHCLVCLGARTAGLLLLSFGPCISECICEADGPGAELSGGAAGCSLMHWLQGQHWSTGLPAAPPRGLCVDPPAPGVPAMLAILRASWFLGVLERFWPRCRLPVERALRRWTSVALKKATMKGCLFWGPCRPIRPASLGLMLCPRSKAAKCIGHGYRRGRGGLHACLTVHAHICTVRRPVLLSAGCARLCWELRAQRGTMLRRPSPGQATW